MIYRTVAALIVVFWLLMTTLLIRNEVNPEDSRVREVPLSHVLKIIYLHQEESHLRIYAGGTPIGHLSFKPKVDKETGQRTAEFTGTVQLQMPEKRRISWDGVLRMSPDYELLRTNWGVALTDPGFLRLEVEAVSGEPKAHVTLRTKDSVTNKDRIIQQMDVATNEAGITDLAHQFGAGAEFIAILQQAKTQAQADSKPIIRSRQSSIRYRGERTETYLVSIEQNGQTLVQCHFSQLGHVLQAKTLLGYTMQPDDLLP
jgi:hypothetical protein